MVERSAKHHFYRLLDYALGGFATGTYFAALAATGSGVSELASHLWLAGVVAYLLSYVPHTMQRITP